MKKNILLKCLLLMPIIILFLTMYSLHYTVQYVKDTAFIFIYDTNVESVQRFSKELKELLSRGYSSDAYSGLYTNMIQAYSKALGEKEAIVTFLMGEKGQIYHSSEHNRVYLSKMLENKANINHIGKALKSGGSGEIMLENNAKKERVYYHRLYSGSDSFTLFMCVERQVVESHLNVNGAAIPVSIIGILLLLVTEYAIWLRMAYVSLKVRVNEKRDAHAD